MKRLLALALVACGNPAPTPAPTPKPVPAPVSTPAAPPLEVVAKPTHGHVSTEKFHSDALGVDKDVVILDGRHEGAYICVGFVNAKGEETDGWSSLIRTPDSSAS